MATANDYKYLFQDLGIDTGKLGCIMLDVEKIPVTDVIPEKELWFKEDEPESHTQGAVSENEPHVTLLYGLMRSGLELKKHVNTLLGLDEDDFDESDAIPEYVTIEKVDFFYSKDPADPYITIIALVKISPELSEANGRLRMLPHIDTFASYKPHITLAYVKYSSDWKAYIETLNTSLAGTSVSVTGLNYGD